MEDGSDILLLHRDGRGMRIPAAEPSVRGLIENLRIGGKTRETLLESGSGTEDALSELLQNIDSRGFLARTLTDSGNPLATLDPVSPSFRFVDIPVEGGFRMSRFAYLRRDGDDAVVESSLGLARLVLHDTRLGAIVGLLSRPGRAEDLTAAGLDAEQARTLMILLCNIGAALPCNEAGQTAEDSAPSLRVWEFHDLLFHVRSRIGRSTRPAGATMRFRDALPPLPATKPPMSDRRLALFKPDLAALSEHDAPFSRILENRRSWRHPAAQPLALDTLGEFLYRSARVKSILPVDPQRGMFHETSTRPAACGGATYTLELYLSVNRVEGLAPGFYHYDPLRHELEHLSEPTASSRRLLTDAMASAGIENQPDLLITLASRFGRVAWKYESVAYSLVLKEVGALVEQMYLVATALDLAPCALGAGNSDVFLRASGLDFFEETSVGEFMLSRRTPGAGAE